MFTLPTTPNKSEAGPAPSKPANAKPSAIASVPGPGGKGAQYSVELLEKARADNAAEKLQAMVSNKATLVRDGKEEEVSLKLLVPGDIIRLAAGDMVPADVRVLSAKDLFLNQAALRVITFWRLRPALMHSKCGNKQTVRLTC
jgi:hypothetical protein